MGCDIHLVVEQRYKDQWVGVRTDRSIPVAETGLFNGAALPPLIGDRNYGFFAALAGVRGKGPEPVGFPTDASLSAQMMYYPYEGDAHSASWLPLKDFAARWLLATTGAGELAAKRLTNDADYAETYGHA
ncbi:hypothetical protein V6O07_03395, partial [Arthrospira platensis SPKY2]